MNYNIKFVLSIFRFSKSPLFQIEDRDSLIGQLKRELDNCNNKYVETQIGTANLEKRLHNADNEIAALSELKKSKILQVRAGSNETIG